MRVGWSCIHVGGELDGSSSECGLQRSIIISVAQETRALAAAQRLMIVVGYHGLRVSEYKSISKLSQVVYIYVVQQTFAGHIRTGSMQTLVPACCS